MNWETLLCLGASITIGARSYLGYPEYAGNFLEAKSNKSWNVINHATSGFTALNLLRDVGLNFDNLKSQCPSLITILIGTNDLKTNTSLEDFKIAYNQLLIKARLIVGNRNIMLFEIPPLQEGIMFPYRIDMNDKIPEYNAIIRELGQQYGLMVHAFKAEAHQFLDGVHLNGQGSKEWGKQLADIILQLRYRT